MSTEEQETQTTDAPANVSWYSELKRRKVFRVMGAYGVGAWLTLQIIDVLSGAFPLPNGTVAIATIILAMGFPIVAALSWVFQLTPDGVVLDINEAKSLRKNRSRLIHFIDVIIICGLLAVVLYLTYDDQFDRSSTETIRLAVLPFENLSGDDEITYLARGIADDIRARLYGVPQILLAAPVSSASLIGKGFDVQTIGRRLTVEHVLEGTIRQSNDRIRVTVQLVDVEPGIVRWVKSYNIQLHDVLEMQNTIALIVASQLEIFLSEDVRNALEQLPTENPTAYDYLLQGHEYLDRPRTSETLSAAETLYNRALDEDPAFALAYSGLCRVYINRYFDTSDIQHVATAETNCRQALALDDSLSIVHTSLGQLYSAINDWGRAEASLATAINIDPRNVGAYMEMANVLAAQQRYVEAEERYRAAIEIQPANWSGYALLAEFFVMQGRFPEAIETYQQVVDFTPDNPSAFNNLGVVYYFIGDFDNAAANFRRALDLDPRRSAYSNTGTMYYLAGNYADAVTMFSHAVDLADTDYRLWGNLADGQRFVPGLEADAVDAYRKAVELALNQATVSGSQSEDLTNIAWYYANLGDRDSAISYLQSADTMPGRTAEEYYVAALTYAVLGLADEAEQARLNAIEGGISQAVLDTAPEFQRGSDE